MPWSLLSWLVFIGASELRRGLGTYCMTSRRNVLGIILGLVRMSELLEKCQIPVSRTENPMRRRRRQDLHMWTQSQGAASVTDPDQCMQSRMSNGTYSVVPKRH